MREILFKAKRKDNGEWVEGYYVYCRKRHYILPMVNKTIGFDEREDEWVEIDPNTLCQYTGLTDKNDKKIWENDILRDKSGDIFRIYWSERLLNYSAKCIKSAFSVFIKQKWDLRILLKSQNDIEVCGNIFDNPDLVEVERCGKFL